MKSVLISIHPKWCGLIASGKKTIEVRKTAPKLPTPFKCYIYETKARTGTPTFVDEDGHVLYTGRGQAIGEFVCDLIGFHPGTDVPSSCVPIEELKEYANGKMLVRWHISDVKIYDKPKELSEFRVEDKPAIKACKHRFRAGQPEYVARHGGWLQGGWGCMKTREPEWCENCLTKPLTRPPQSWCYVDAE